jgi:methylated-DNA-[protein]-cysteine S-methyltransferase
MAADLSLLLTLSETPVGPLAIAASERGIVATAFTDDEDLFAAHLAEELHGRARRDDRALADARAEAEAYFARQLRRFSVPVDLSVARTDFTRAVYGATMAVPYGQMRTYGDVAAEAGSPRGWRAAGHALRICPIELWIPCHRIVPAGPGFGTYGGHPERREYLLRLEGAM